MGTRVARGGTSFARVGTDPHAHGREPRSRGHELHPRGHELHPRGGPGRDIAFSCLSDAGATPWSRLHDLDGKKGMIPLDDLLATWSRCKSRFTGRRLDAPCSVEHEYEGKQWGHPSTYAFVRFECAPAESLVFEMRAEWPPHLTADYCDLLRDAMCAAIVDALVAADCPHLGCSLACTEVRWDDVASSEFAVYRATRAAMTHLREKERWSFVRGTT
jgi:hypothetical protein